MAVRGVFETKVPAKTQLQMLLVCFLVKSGAIMFVGLGDAACHLLQYAVGLGK